MFILFPPIHFTAWSRMDVCVGVFSQECDQEWVKRCFYWECDWCLIKNRCILCLIKNGTMYLIKCGYLIKNGFVIDQERVCLVFAGQFTECSISGLYIGDTAALPQLDPSGIHLWNQTHHHPHLQGRQTCPLATSLKTNCPLYSCSRQQVVLLTVIHSKSLTTTFLLRWLHCM